MSRSQALRDLQFALEKCYSGDQSTEAGCVADALEDLGWALTPAPLRRVAQEPLPLASTAGLPKRRSS